MSPPGVYSGPACHLHPTVITIALGRDATQRRPHRGRQVLFAEVIPSLYPHEHCDGLVPHPSICGTELPPAQRRHPIHTNAGLRRQLRRAGLLARLGSTLPQCWGTLLHTVLTNITGNETNGQMDYTNPLIGVYFPPRTFRISTTLRWGRLIGAQFLGHGRSEPPESAKSRPLERRW